MTKKALLRAAMPIAFMLSFSACNTLHPPMSEFSIFDHVETKKDTVDLGVSTGGNFAAWQSNDLINTIIECRGEYGCDSKLDRRPGGFGVHVEKNGVSAGVGFGYLGVDITRNIFDSFYFTAATSFDKQGQINIMWKLADLDDFGFAFGLSFRHESYGILFTELGYLPVPKYRLSHHLLSSQGFRMLVLTPLGGKTSYFMLRGSAFVGKFPFSNRPFASIGLNIALE